MLHANHLSRSCHEENLREMLALCHRMTSERDLATLLNIISLEAKAIVEADRLTIFLLNKENELWSVATPETQSIRFGAHLGVAGAAIMTGRPVNVADAYRDPRFFKGVDFETGYRTRSLLAVPLINATGEVVGVCEAINKENGGSFTRHDEDMMNLLGPLVAHTVETVQLTRQARQDHSELVRRLRDVLETSAIRFAEESSVTRQPRKRVRLAEPPKVEGGQRRIKEAEKCVLQSALAESNGDKEKAASLLGISTRTLYRKLSKFQIALAAS